MRREKAAFYKCLRGWDNFAYVRSRAGQKNPSRGRWFYLEGIKVMMTLFNISYL
jgi:hypothetical protein